MAHRVNHLVCEICNGFVSAEGTCSRCGSLINNTKEAPVPSAGRASPLPRAEDEQLSSAASRTIDRLIEGHRRFRTTTLPGCRAEFERLARGQSPVAALVTCSDSRVQPHLITQASPGDLFMIRNAGNIVPPYEQHTSEVAAIEYAVRVLETPHIIVCGHSHCGAMSGLLYPEAVASLSNVRRWVEQSSKALRVVEKSTFYSQAERLAGMVRENVLLQLEHLMTYPFVSARVEAGSLRLHAWVYEIESGLIHEFNPEARRFTPLGDTRMTYA